MVQPRPCYCRTHPNLKRCFLLVPNSSVTGGPCSRLLTPATSAVSCLRPLHRPHNTSFLGPGPWQDALPHGDQEGTRPRAAGIHSQPPSGHFLGKGQEALAAPLGGPGGGAHVLALWPGPSASRPLCRRDAHTPSSPWKKLASDPHDLLQGRGDDLGVVPSVTPRNALSPRWGRVAPSPLPWEPPGPSQRVLPPRRPAAGRSGAQHLCHCHSQALEPRSEKVPLAPSLDGCGAKDRVWMEREEDKGEEGREPGWSEPPYCLSCFPSWDFPERQSVHQGGNTQADLRLCGTRKSCTCRCACVCKHVCVGASLRASAPNPGQEPAPRIPEALSSSPYPGAQTTHRL